MVIRVNGGPDVMEREYFDPGAPDQGEVLIENKAVGLNYIDTYFRSGLYPADLPLTLGSEAAGEIVAVGPGVSGFSVGDRVACATARGSYCTHWRVPATQVVHLPDDISFEDAAAMMLKGMTACFLAEDVWPLKAGQTALVHAAAGGVGSILVPWLRDKGVVVIAHSGSAAKAASVAADFSLHAPMDDLAAQVRERTNGEGVDIVYDGIGKAGWSASLASVKPRGLLVSYGNASGPVPPVNLLDLSRGGSLYVTRPTLFTHIAKRDTMVEMAANLFATVASGKVTVPVNATFALTDAANAHRALEGRGTTGSTVLLP